MQDPVCGMPFRLDATVIRYEHGGRLNRFCIENAVRRITGTVEADADPATERGVLHEEAGPAPHEDRVPVHPAEADAQAVRKVFEGAVCAFLGREEP